jgi:hypothetical protein
MEDVLEIYHLPYDQAYPVVCMDESNKQMIGEVMPPIPCAPGQPARIDHEYVRNGVSRIMLIPPPRDQHNSPLLGGEVVKGLGVKIFRYDSPSRIMWWA